MSQLESMSLSNSTLDAGMRGEAFAQKLRTAKKEEILKNKRQLLDRCLKSKSNSPEKMTGVDQKE